MSRAEVVYCKDCKFCLISGSDQVEMCTRVRTVDFVDLVSGPYSRTYDLKSCKSERYPDIEYVLSDELPCGSEGKYFEAR